MSNLLQLHILFINWDNLWTSETKSLLYCTFNRQQQSRTTTDPYNVWGEKKEERRRDLGGLWSGCLLVLQELQSQAALSWQVDTIIYSSVQGHFTDWWIRPRARGVADSGALGLLFGYWGCVCSPLSLSSTPSTASAAILDLERGKGGKKYGDKERTGGRGGEGGGEERWAVCGLRGGKGPGIWLITGGVRVQGQCPGPSSL